MANTERPTEGHSPAEKPKQGIEISITPDTERGISFKRELDNTLVIGGKGEFQVKLQLPNLPTLKEEGVPESLLTGMET